MTKSQRSYFYFPAWSRAAQAHGWQSKASLITAVRLETWASPELNQTYQAIWDLALSRALGEGRAEKPDDFRKACHVVAIGKEKSSNDLGNDELDRVVALFNLLANPEDLRALMAWESPDQQRRKRILHWIGEKCVESYVVALCREKFGHDEPRNLPFEQLKQLHVTLRNRPKAYKDKSAIPF